MAADEARRRSRWIIRVLEWDDPRARYPNLWHEGMPRRILAYATVGSRLRLGDLLAVFHPSSQKHAERAERFVGIARVTALHRADDPAFVWVEVETAHRFRAPLDLGEAPRRVFLCCDPGWPERDVSLFRRVFDAAVGQGWRPSADEREEMPATAPAAAPPAAPDDEPRSASAAGDEDDASPDAAGPSPAQHPAPGPASTPATGRRYFAGASYSGEMRDIRSGTWMAVLELADDRLRLVRLDGMARSGFQAALRDSDPTLQQVEAIGLDFPFGLPLAFAESLLGGAFPEEGWWALAKKLDHMSRPDYLVAVQEFAAEHGEMKRLTDEASGGVSPLRRTDPDRGPQAYHGIRLIAEERSRYAVRPFETAQGRLLLEVAPSRVRERLAGPQARDGKPGLHGIVRGLESLDHLPVTIDAAFRKRCASRPAALDAVLAARCAAEAVLSGEAGRTASELAPGAGDRVRREGWIYGLGPAD